MKDIIFLLACALIVIYCICTCDTVKSESFESFENVTVDSELVKNWGTIAKELLAGGAKVPGNLNITGDIDGININRTNGDWLRVNDSAKSVGRTAMYGKVSINEDRQNGGGLNVGDWDMNPGRGNVLSYGIGRNGGDWFRINDNKDSVGRTALYGKLSINDEKNGMGGLNVGDWDKNPGKGNILSNSISRSGGDWLRVNDNANSVGRTAMYGKLSINDTRNGHSGLVVGDWDKNPELGGIVATKKICINDSCLTEDDIKRYKNIMPKGYINIVNRRPLFGIGTKIVAQPFTGTTPKKLFEAITYGPFGYNVPPVAPGATRKFRMYGVYTDGITGPQDTGPIVRVSIFNDSSQEQGKFVDFKFPLTWGGMEEMRDAFSNSVDDPKDDKHSMLYTFIQEGCTGNLAVRWQYIELQTLDIY